MSLSIVIPVLNEEGNIQELYEMLKVVVAGVNEIIFVDDGSTDGSKDVLRAIAQRDNTVRIVEFKRNYGQTAALAAGFAQAASDWVVTLDADLQNDVKDIHKLIEKANEGYDVVSGWRKKRKDSLISRRFPSYIANKLISLITGVKLHDYGCTLKMYRRDVIQNLSLYGEMHRFLPAYLVWQGASLAEIEVNHFPRRSGRSHYGLERVFKVVLDLLVAKFFFGYLTKPIYIFGGVSLISFLLSCAVGALVIIRKVFFAGQWMSPLILIAFFLSGISVLCLLMGFLAEVLTRIYFEKRGHLPYQIK